MGGPDSVCSFRPRPAASRGISWGIRRRTAMCRRWLPENGTSRSDGTSGTCFTCGEDIAKQVAHQIDRRAGEQRRGDDAEGQRAMVGQAQNGVERHEFLASQDN